MLRITCPQKLAKKTRIYDLAMQGPYFSDFPDNPCKLLALREGREVFW